MPFQQFDRSKLCLLPLAERKHDMSMSEIIDPLDKNEIAEFNHPDLDRIADAVITARKREAAVILMYGAHVIKKGLPLFLIRLMEQGLVTHFATNGAGSIHDFELALAGGTTESVAKYISEGQFGLWNETGLLNEAINQGAGLGLGFGESAGKYIHEHHFPYEDKSVLAAGYRLHVPVTVHVGIGNDIVHEHPNCDGASIGKASYVDFLIYAQSVTNLEGGVFLNFGSAVAGPEVYLKALAMARNVAKQEGRTITDFTTAVFDVQPLGSNDISHEPEKNNPHYYFRPWKTILARTVADGGRSFYVEGDHRATLGHLTRKILLRA